MLTSYIDYGKLIDDSMHVIVQRVLQDVAKNGLPGEHHFFISFSTLHPEVIISEAVRERYPTEMTIVLQHQFDGLLVSEKHFEVTLSFDGVPEKIVIPFDALTAFADPSVKFGLQFRQMGEEKNQEVLDALLKPDNEETGELSSNEKKKSTEDINTISSHDNVINIDAFRKKE